MGNTVGAKGDQGVQARSENGRVTLSEVAAKAGVSLAVASKALSGRPHVSEATRLRVFGAAEALGYQRRQRQSDTPTRQAIAAAFDSFGSAYSAELFTGALHAATRGGVELIPTLLPGRREGLASRAWLDAQIATGVQGLFLAVAEIQPSLIEAVRETRFPMVAIDPMNPVGDGLVMVGATNSAGAADATRHLIELGHTDIGFAGMYIPAEFSVERFAGFRTALERADLHLNRGWVFPGTTDYEVGFDVGTRLAQMNPRPTAVVCVCDTVAFGVIEGARRGGIRTPEDLSVVGFDDQPHARWSSPPLTTVRQPLRQMGSIAVRTLLRLARGLEPDTFRVQMRTTLQVRGSTAPPGGGKLPNPALIAGRVSHPMVEESSPPTSATAPPR